MGWGTAANVTTVNLNQGSDDPSLAREELYNALVELTAVINGRGTSNGVAPLGAGTKISNAYLPDSITSSTSTNLTISPTTGKTIFENIINLNPQTVAELNARTSSSGDVAYCSNGAGGSACLAVYDGTNWKRITLGATIAT